MRRRWAVAVLALGCVAVGAALSGCPAAHESYPTTACMTDSDCYKGETCLMNVCMPPSPDAPPQDLSFPSFDFASVPDGGADQ